LFIDEAVADFQAFWDIVKAVASGIWETITEVFADIMDIVTSIITDIGDIFKGIINTITNPFKTIVKAVKQLLKGDLLGAVKTVGKGIANAFINPINVFISGLNLVLTPLRAIIKLLAKATGKNLSMSDIKIPKIPALAIGTNDIESEGIYHLHEGEAVVPKKYNPATGGYDDGQDNKQIIDLLVSLNASMLAFSEKEMNIYMDSRKVAEATYDDLQQVGRNKGQSNVMSRS
jgi:hypothetical protein